MKRIGLVVAALMLVAAMAPAFAAETGNGGKNECLLASKGCKNEVDSIQKKIKRLQQEIKKGKKVYSTEEIHKLGEKLKQANDLLDDLLKGSK